MEISLLMVVAEIPISVILTRVTTSERPPTEAQSRAAIDRIA